MPSLQDCRYRAGTEEPPTPPQSALETPRPRQRRCKFHRQTLFRPHVWLRDADQRRLPSCRHPRGSDLSRPSAPGSSRFLASRIVPELSSPGTSLRRLERASSSGQQRQPLRSLSGWRRSALFSAGVSLQPPVFAAAHNKGNM